MMTKKTLRWVLFTAGTLFAVGVAWAEYRECVDCYPCASSPSGGAVLCCSSSAC